MSGARFARTGRFRLFAGLFLIVLIVGIMAMYHSSSIQCENNIESIRRQAESQRYQMERIKEQEANKHLESEKDLEDKLKEQREKHEKEILDLRSNLEQLQQTHNLLKSDHNQLVNECAKSKKQQLDDANSLEKKLQSLRAELKKAKTLQENEIALWKEKFNTVVNDKERLEKQQSTNCVDQDKRMKLLESIVAEFSSNCVYKPKTLSKDLMLQHQINKPLQTPETTQTVVAGKSGRLHFPSFDKPKNEKNFKLQESVSEGFYYIPIKVTKGETIESMNITNRTFKSQETKKNNSKTDNGVGDGGEQSLKQLPLALSFSAKNNRSLILNSVENFQIVPKPLKKMSAEEMPETQLKQQPENVAQAQSAGQASPLSAPRKLTSTQSTKTAQRVLEQANNASSSLTSTSSSTSLPPLPLPPNQQQQRKQLPAMVAPIPEFDQFIKDENEKAPKKTATAEGDANGADIDAAIENVDQGTNNRYANAVNGPDGKKSAKNVAPQNGGGANEHQNKDIGLEAKDNEPLANGNNFNFPGDEDENNFFDAGEKNVGGDFVNGAIDDAKNNNGEHNDDDDDDDDLGLGVGAGADIAVKNHNLLEADSLNNEVAGDQGKEFPDGLRLEDANEEDEDEDEYANPVARQQGAQAIRN